MDLLERPLLSDPCCDMQAPAGHWTHPPPLHSVFPLFLPGAQIQHLGRQQTHGFSTLASAHLCEGRDKGSSLCLPLEFASISPQLI